MKQVWLAMQSAEFKRGYDDACAALPRDKTQSAEYLRGYDQARDDNEYHDYA
jgi:hypothetical protein